MAGESAGEIECRHCGGCCRQAFSHVVSPDDLDRWRKDGRHDLISAFREEEDIGNGDAGLGALRRFKPCRFYKTGPSGAGACDIYSHRPRVCRMFIPGKSRLCPAKK